MTEERQSKPRNLATRAVHAGEEVPKPDHSLITPITLTAPFAFRDTEDLRAYAAKEKARFEYARMGHPTQAAVERKLAALEGAEAGLVFASGMNALTTTLLSLLSQGQHLVITHQAYRRTLQFCQQELPRWGIECTTVPVGEEEAAARAMQDNTALIFSECPTNPHLYLPNISRLAEIAHAQGALLLIDSTFATPVNLHPLERGADLVVHSATKYLGGHNDLVAGVLVGRATLVETVRDFHHTLGGMADPFTCFLLLRGLKTLPLRVQRQNETALQVAQFLEQHSKVTQVYYPGLPSHPHHQRARKQMRGFGGVVSFEIRGDWAATCRFLDALELCTLASSFGGPETLVYHPAGVTRYDLTEKERQALGYTDQLIRLAVGLEAPEDLLADLEQALAQV